MGVKKRANPNKVCFPNLLLNAQIQTEDTYQVNANQFKEHGPKTETTAAAGALINLQFAFL